MSTSSISCYSNFLLLLSLCTCLSCAAPEVESNVDYVARVGPYTLHRERVQQPYIYQAGTSDSLKAANQFIEQWAIDKAFEIEAMEHLESRDELDQLIDNYKSSLITHLFEKQLIEQHLDSVISKNELQEYYHENKSQYVLRSSILRINFINIKKNHSAEDDILEFWKRHENQSAMDSLIALCHESATVFLLKDSAWYKLEDLKSIVPGNFLKNGSNNRITEQIFSNDTATYFLRVLERIPDTEIAPLSFIEKQARKVILYRRKQKLISSRREQIYRDAIKANRVKLYE